MNRESQREGLYRIGKWPIKQREGWLLGGVMSSRGRYATPAEFPPHDGTPYRRLHVRCKVWEMSIAQGPFSVAPCETLALRFATFASPYVVLYPLRQVRPGS